MHVSTVIFFRVTLVNKRNYFVAVIFFRRNKSSIFKLFRFAVFYPRYLFMHQCCLKAAYDVIICYAYLFDATYFFLPYSEFYSNDIIIVIGILNILHIIINNK